jgi:flagellar biosynthetic protein FliQ
MSDQQVIDIAWKTLWLALKVAAPALIAAMLMGLVVSVFQAATQVNEQTLSFIPKIVAMTVALIVFGPWLIKLMVTFTTQLILSIPEIGR